MMETSRRAVLAGAGALAAGPSAVRAAAAAPSVLGVGHGLNHVSILVRDLPAMTAIFRDRLGFNVKSWGRFPDGLENAGVDFSDRTYLEFLSVYDPRKAAETDEAAFLKTHEGAVGVGLETSSVSDAAAFLLSRGIPATIHTTTGADYAEPGEKSDTVWIWRDIELPKTLPGGPFLIEYNTAATAARAKADPAAEQKRALDRFHPNGAVRMSSAWIAVRDLGAAVGAYARLGLVAGRPFDLPDLAARGCEIAAGGGALLLVTPSPAGRGQDRSGPAAEFLADRGEGLMGVTVEVADLEKTRAGLMAHATEGLAPRVHPNGDLLIPASLTHGVWLRLTGRRRAASFDGAGPHGGGAGAGGCADRRPHGRSSPSWPC